ncbi:hypothetical protein B6D52_03325 [Candidatus Parcubacteria bacterium 4484_255]|nr:MAG: hypothetical protein B6D52_03325 [Candidatus Parcubacteria bacterium 4484_255]
MGPVNKEQARHEAYMYRLLSSMLDDKDLACKIFFKGGTCARMLGYLDRFSVDLDFDLDKSADKKKLRQKLHNIFNSLGLSIKDESKKALQFFLKYPASLDARNTIKLEILDKTYNANNYKPCYLEPIKRTAICQTIDTMFAHKLIAPISRYEQGNSIAGRDIYDIHHFFFQGYNYNKQVIVERRKISVLNFFQELKGFIDKKVNQKIIEQDLNVLLEYNKFKKIKAHLKTETLYFIDKEIASLMKGQ